MHEKREEQDETPRYRRASQAHLRAPHQSQRSISPARSLGVISDHDNRSTKTGDSQISLRLPQRSFEDDDEAYDAAPQDIVEVWFPGCHAVSIVKSRQDPILYESCLGAITSPSLSCHHEYTSETPLI